MKSFVSIAALSSLAAASGVFQNSTTASAPPVSSSTKVTVTGAVTEVITESVPVTVCPTDVVSCPARESTHKVTVTKYYTYCPEDGPAAKNGSTTFTNTYTQYVTTVVPVISCPPEVECPASTPKVVPVRQTVTWCPPAGATPVPTPGPGPAPAETSKSLKTVVVTECPAESPNCPTPSVPRTTVSEVPVPPNGEKPNASAGSPSPAPGKPNGEKPNAPAGSPSPAPGKPNGEKPNAPAGSPSPAPGKPNSSPNGGTPEIAQNNSGNRAGVMTGAVTIIAAIVYLL